MKLVTLEEIEPMLLSPIPKKYRDGASSWVNFVTATLVGKFPLLSGVDESHPAFGFAKTMVTMACVRILRNPKGIASETAGPFAHTLFDSTDPFKELFSLDDRRSLEELLAPDSRTVIGSVRVARDRATNPMTSPLGYVVRGRPGKLRR